MAIPAPAATGQPCSCPAGFLLPRRYPAPAEVACIASPAAMAVLLPELLPSGSLTCRSSPPPISFSGRRQPPPPPGTEPWWPDLTPPPVPRLPPRLPPLRPQQQPPTVARASSRAGGRGARPVDRASAQLQRRLGRSPHERRGPASPGLAPAQMRPSSWRQLLRPSSSSHQTGPGPKVRVPWPLCCAPT
uniref:Predicted protein n=1 Tax=Hordeum vulgare subsp. vulgare TaxID=112509 RepID=F2E481_HORVV|nr:predicted protein [Hordeum vulgare subsp. vulgare]